MKRSKARSKAGRPANANSDETRRTILDAAITCFAESGFGSTSTRLIAEQAGVNVALIYHYFKNKNALFLEAHRDVQAPALELAREKLQSATSLTSGWSELCEKIYAIHIERPELARFNAVVEVETLRNPELAKALGDNEWKSYFKQLASLAVKTGEIQRSEEKALVQLMLMIIQGIARYAVQASFEDYKLTLEATTRLFQGKLITQLKG